MDFAFVEKKASSEAALREYTWVQKIKRFMDISDSHMQKFPAGAALFLFFIALFSCLAPVIFNLDPNAMDLSSSFEAPSLSHIFGTDEYGRDVFLRTLYGGRASLSIGIVSMVVSLFIGFVYGGISGYFGGRVDDLMMAFLNMIISIPAIIYMTMFQSFFGHRDVQSLIVIIAITSWMGTAKVIRGQVLEIKERDFVLASRLMGGGFFHIMRKHLFSNAVPAVIYIATMNTAGAIMSEATLSFMGLGLSVDIPSWGSILMESQKCVLLNKWWTVVAPGVMIIGTLWSVVSIGEYLRKSISRKNFIN